MNRLLLIAVSFLLSFSAKAQYTNYIFWEGFKIDSTYFLWDTIQMSNIVTDTSGLWQIGSTAKPFFSTGDTFGRAIMTDTVNSYPLNVNAWFMLPVTLDGGDILSFKHKFKTSWHRDGCIVEISDDGGNSWENVKGDCNADTLGYFGIITDNFYSFNDTIDGGEPAFSGISNGWITSRFQLFDCCFIKPAAKSSNWCNMYAMLVRFRFVSDSITDANDGWIIDSIKVNNNNIPTSVDGMQQKRLTEIIVTPNPSHDGIIYFPSIPGEDNYKIQIINSLGQQVLECNYKHELNLSMQPKGIYFYNVSHETSRYTGKILLE